MVRRRNTLVLSFKLVNLNQSRDWCYRVTYMRAIETRLIMNSGRDFTLKNYSLIRYVSQSASIQHYRQLESTRPA